MEAKVTKRIPAFLSELPAVPKYNPVARAIEKTTDPEIIAALQFFSHMPASTGIFANPVRYHQSVTCAGTAVELNIRSFGFRGCLLEEDVIAESADTLR